MIIAKVISQRKLTHKKVKEPTKLAHKNVKIGVPI